MATLYNELRSVLEKRAKPETQFNIFRSIHAETITRMIDEYECQEDDVLTTLYLSKFIMTGDVTSHTGRQQTLTDDARVEMILKNLLEGQKHLPEMPLQKHLFLLQLTWQIAWETDKIFQRNILDNSFPTSLLYSRIIDHLLIPLISEWVRVLSKLTEDPIDYQWVFAEILASLQNDFPFELYPVLKKLIPSDITPDEFYFGGWVICNEYLKYLRVSDYVPEVFPDATNLHLTDKLTLSGFILYRDSTKEVLDLSGSKVITTEGSIEVDENRMVIFQNLASIDHSAIAKHGIPLKNGKYRIIIEPDQGNESTRFLYLYNSKNKSKDLGIWVFFLIQSEEINFSMLENIIQMRIPQLNAILQRETSNMEDFKVDWTDLHEGWLKALIVDLQEGVGYTGPIEDTQKSQKYLPIAFSEAKFEKDERFLYYDTADSDKRLFQKSSDDFIEEIINLYSLADINYISGLNILRLIFTKTDRKFKNITSIPLEYLFYVALKPEENFLIMPTAIIPKKDRKIDIASTKLLSFVAINKQIGDVFHKEMAFQPRRNLQRQLRIISETKGTYKSLKRLVRERLDQTFSVHIKDIKVESMWDKFFASLKDLESTLNAEQSKIGDKILSHEEKIQLELNKLRNQVVYFILKDIILPFKLLQIELAALLKFKALGNDDVGDKAIQSVERRTQTYLNKEKDLANFISEFVKNAYSDDIDQNSSLDLFMEEKKQAVLTLLSELNDSELKDILISL